MKIYVVFGNLWLLSALVLMLGRTVERSNPTMYSFFGLGGWHYPIWYHVMVLACVVIASAHFRKAARARTDE